MPTPLIAVSGAGTVPVGVGFGFTIHGAGRVLLFSFSASPSCGGNNPSIADSFGNSWTPIALGDGFGVWYCITSTTGSGTITITQPGNAGLGGNYQIAWWEVTGWAGATAAASAGVGETAALAMNAQILFDSLPVAASAVPYNAVIVAITSSSGNPLVLLIVGSSSGSAAGAPSSVEGWTSNYPTYPATGPLVLWYFTFSTLSNDIVTDICIRAGLTSSQIDVSLLTNANIFGGSTAVTGYLVERPTAASEVLKHLMQAYFFDACETNGTMRFVPRGMASALTIPELDLGLVKDKAKVNPETISQAQDLPLLVNVLYDDIALDYQQNSQQRSRSARIIQTKQQKTISLPIVMAETQALQIAETQLYLDWLERNGFKFNLGSPQYSLLDPTDVIQFVYETLTFQVRISDTSIGVDLVTAISSVNEDPSSFLSYLSQPTGNPQPRNPLKILNFTSLFLFDIPLLVDSDSNPDNTGFYFAMASQADDWTGGVLYESSDDVDFGQEASSSANTTYGNCTTTLGAPASPWTLDTVNTLTVEPVIGSLSGVTLADMLNGANAAIVGSELIQFQTAVDNGNGTFTISNFLRGMKGTEGSCASHGSNELFLLLSTAIQRVPMAISQLAQPLYYKGVSVGTDPTTIDAQSFTVNGADLKPYAPAGIGGTVDGSGNIIITWIRRTRIGGEADWADGVLDVPLSEQAELYDVDVLNGSTVVRTISELATATCVYTQAMQVADFGSAQSSVSVNVYQRSVQVGRGLKANGTAPTPGGWPTPWPAIYPGEQLFYVNGS
jgi:hypothetical protein